MIISPLHTNLYSQSSIDHYVNEAEELIKICGCLEKRDEAIKIYNAVFNEAVHYHSSFKPWVGYSIVNCIIKDYIKENKKIDGIDEKFR